MSPLSLRIAELRQAKKWSQTDLAARAGVSRATVNRIENANNRRVDLDVLEKLAKALGVAPGLLIVEDEKKRR